MTAVSDFIVLYIIMETAGLRDCWGQAGMGKKLQRQGEILAFKPLHLPEKRSVGTEGISPSAQGVLKCKPAFDSVEK